MCLSTLFCANDGGSFLNLRFENDVKTYGTETIKLHDPNIIRFENDVKTYGTETKVFLLKNDHLFENDVKTYGTETIHLTDIFSVVFENDVKTYGTETESHLLPYIPGLRMM